MPCVDKAVRISSSSTSWGIPMMTPLGEPTGLHIVMATSMAQNLVSLAIVLAYFVLCAVTMMKFDRLWTFATAPPAILLISLATASPFSFATLCLLSTGLMVTVASPGHSLRGEPGSESPRGLFFGLTTTVNPLSPLVAASLLLLSIASIREAMAMQYTGKTAVYNERWYLTYHFGAMT